MVGELVPILVLLAVAVVIVAGIIGLTHLFGPKHPDPVKLSPYESGMEPVGEARTRFSIRFYIIAMLFVLFDIEVVFFYPWAVVFKKLLSMGSFILIEMLVFVGLLLVGYLYAWKKGALEWD
ncbi:MAG TPA: NADH-quinone oxidoreductase subunit A [Bacteroidetes bacterium]|nr:NADH-quinone oxidoreductase subunit A [Bacteroidota bacterium]